MSATEIRIAEIEREMAKNQEIMSQIINEGCDKKTRCWNETEFYACMNSNYYMSMELEELKKMLTA